jgi:hypothetical protein
VKRKEDADERREEEQEQEERRKMREKTTNEGDHIHSPSLDKLIDLFPFLLSLSPSLRLSLVISCFRIVSRFIFPSTRFACDCRIQ